MTTLNRADNKLGQVQINKGNLADDLPLIAWDAVETCEPAGCNVSSTCPYQKIGKCELQMKYLTNVHQTLAPYLEASKDPLKVMRAGLQIVPLYHHLIRFKMYAHGRSVTYTTDKGDIKVRSIFKEIRETIKVIEMLHKNLFEVARVEGDKGQGWGVDVDGNPLPKPTPAGALVQAMQDSENAFKAHQRKPTLKRKSNA